MNASDRVGWIWWAPGRCASRSAYAFLSHFGFTDRSAGMPPAYPGRADGYTHNVGVPAGCESYPVMMQVRNPYSRLVSMWRLDCLSDHLPPDQAGVNFARYVEASNSLDLVAALRIRVPDVVIRQETLAEDLVALPFVDLSDPSQMSLFDRHITSNRYAGAGMPGWRSHYDRRLAGMVYHANREVFEAFGYGRDSWKGGR